jgi:hypothetical protein
MDRYFDLNTSPFGFAELHNGGPLGAIRALNRQLFINNLFDPDLFRGS